MRVESGANATQAVTVRETTLFDALCVALESGEFVQIRGNFSDGRTGRCAWGVIEEMRRRSGLLREEDQDATEAHAMLHPRFLAIERRAGQLLGYDGIAAANDSGHSFKLIAAALRRARLDVEAGL